MPRHPAKTTHIHGPSSIGKTHALLAFAQQLGRNITLLSTTGEAGFLPFSIEAVRSCRTPFLAIDEIAQLSDFNPEVFAEALAAMEEGGAVHHLILVSWNDRAAKEEGFQFPRGTKSLQMRERRTSLALDGDTLRFEMPTAQAA